MTTPTPTDNTNVWFELYAVEVPTGQNNLIQLPAVDPEVLGPWRLSGSHPHQKNNDRGAPVRTVVAVFTRPVSTHAALPVQAAAPPAARPTNVRQNQPLPAPAPRPAPRNAVSQVVSGLEALADRVVAGVARSVVPVAEQIATAAGMPAAPAAAPAGPPAHTVRPAVNGELACKCPSPSPAADNGAAAVPCRACGGWIQMGEGVSATPEPEQQQDQEQQQDSPPQ